MKNSSAVKHVQSVQRAIDILECFSDIDAQLSLQDISQQTGLNKSTAHGILKTLCINNYIRKVSSRKYMLGFGLTNKFRGSKSVSRSVLLRESLDILKEITEKELITSSMYMVEEDGISLLHREVPRSGTYVLYAAEDCFNVPLYCSASGKLYLAYLEPGALNEYLYKIGRLKTFSSKTISSMTQLRDELVQIKKQGFSLENGEVSEGISAIAHPIFDPYGKMFATISVTSVYVYLEKEGPRLQKLLHQKAAMLEEKLFHN